MQTYQSKLGIAIFPIEIIEKQSQLKLSDEEVLALIKIVSIERNGLILSTFLKKYEISREVLNTLSKKNLIKLVEVSNNLEIEYLGFNQEQVNNFEVEINREMIDRLTFLLNRKLQVYELDKIKSWLKLEYKLSEIEEAISKAAIGGVDNFNYIEKVLFNNQDTHKQSKIKIERNFDLY